MKHLMITATAVALFSSPVMAGTVDLSSWIENGIKGNNGAGTWTVQGTNKDSVFQSSNGTPTVFFESGSNAQGTSLKGQITVSTGTGDNDFVGFVLGYQNNEMNSTAADFWLIDWKQADQTIVDAGISQVGERGLALSKVSGDIANTPGSYAGFWGKTGPVSEVLRGSSLFDTGWVAGTTYEFELIFTSSLIEVKVDGVTELSYTSSDNGGLFTDGAFGFYNNSQQDVRYAGITGDVLPPSTIPLPASSILLIAGLGGLGLMRRRKG